MHFGYCLTHCNNDSGNVQKLHAQQGKLIWAGVKPKRTGSYHAKCSRAYPDLFLNNIQLCSCFAVFLIFYSPHSPPFNLGSAVKMHSGHLKLNCAVILKFKFEICWLFSINLKVRPLWSRVIEPVTLTGFVVNQCYLYGNLNWNKMGKATFLVMGNDCWLALMK